MGYACVARNGASGVAVFTNGLAIRTDGYYQASAQQYTTLSGFDVASAGIKSTFVFQLRFDRIIRLSWRCRFRVRWEVVVAGGAGSTVRVNVDMRRNGVANADGITKATGTARAVDALNVYVENNYVIDLPRMRFVPGDTLDVRVELETVGTSGAGNPNIRLHHPDPLANPNSLAFEVDSPLVEPHGIDIARAEE